MTQEKIPDPQSEKKFKRRDLQNELRDTSMEMTPATRLMNIFRQPCSGKPLSGAT